MNTIETYYQEIKAGQSLEFTILDKSISLFIKNISIIPTKEQNGNVTVYTYKNNEKVIRLFFYADEETSIKNVVDMYGVSPKVARAKIDSIDKARASYYKYYTGKEWDDVSNYDLCINTTKLGFEKSVDAVIAYMRSIGIEV